MRDELVEVVSADETFEVVNEVKALLIGHLAVGVLGVNTVVIDDKLGVLMVLAELRDRVLCFCQRVFYRRTFTYSDLPRAFQPRMQEK